MLQEISQAILSSLQDAGIDTREISYKEIVNRKVGALQRPAVCISISAGNWTKVTMDKSKLNLTVSLLLMVQNVNNEKKRRFDVYRLMESIATALFIVSLDLDLQGLLKPQSFSDITDNYYAGAGYQMFQMNFSCSYLYEQEKEDLGILRSIVNSYIADDEVIGESSTVSVGKYWGGRASSTYTLPPLFGGRASTPRWGEPVWGGNAYSTYNK